MSDLLQKVRNLQTLPPWERNELNREIEKEYALCKNIQIPHVRLDLEQAAGICILVTKKLNIEKVGKIVLNSKLATGTQGLYHEDEIHFPTEYITLAILIHELAHHLFFSYRVPGPIHGHGFLECVKLCILVLKGEK